MEPVHDVRMSETTPLVKQEKLNQAFREPIPCYWQISNVAANIFTCGTNRQRHQEQFVQAVTLKNLDVAKRHYLHGAHIDLSNQAVQTVLRGKDTAFTGFLAVNADSGPRLAAFKDLIAKGYFEMAAEMLWTAPMESSERIELLMYARQSREMATILISRLGAQAAQKIEIWNAIATSRETLLELLKNVAKSEKACPFPLLQCYTPYTLNWKGGDIGFEMYSDSQADFNLARRFCWNIWTHSLLYIAIIHSNKALVQDIIYKIPLNDVPSWIDVGWAVNAISHGTELSEKDRAWMTRKFTEVFSYIDN